MREMAQRRAESSESGVAPGGVRERILTAAIDLLSHHGRDALTTRAVAAAAGVQAPTLYRLFGDKSTLLDAVAEHGLSVYLREKQAWKPGSDPVENLRTGWDLHVAFGLTNPAIFSIMSGDPRPGGRSPALTANLDHLHRLVRSLALTGRLQMTEERAVDLIGATARGTVLTLLELPEDRRNLGLSEVAREAVIAAIVGESSATGAPGLAQTAVTLRALLPGTSALTPGEQALMNEWLGRLAASPKAGTDGRHDSP